MQFKVGDVVVHPVYGVGRVVKIEEKRFSEEGVRLYYQVALAKSTIWIPIEAQAAIGLRPVTAKSDLDQYRNLLKSPPVPLPKNHHQRRLELIGRLKQDSFQVVCEVVRDLTAWSQRKPLGPTDKATLQKTRKKLYQEWATAAGLSMAEAIKEVESLAAGNSASVHEGDMTKLTTDPLKVEKPPTKPVPADHPNLAF